MTATILTRWKLLLNLSTEEGASLPSLFNRATSRTFIKAMGGRATIEYAPATLTCTTRFYELLQEKTKGIGFSGPKFPLNHARRDFNLHMRFRLHGTVLVIEIERSCLPFREQNALDEILFHRQAEVVALAKAVFGLIKDPNPGFDPLQQVPKAYYCMRVVGDYESLPPRNVLVELLTRHRMPSDMVVDSVFDRNAMLQSDASTLLIDRQGVVMAIPSEIADDETVIRRFQAACNMFEMVTAIERMTEQKTLGTLNEVELGNIDAYFLAPDERFRFSTSSRFLWTRITSEFGFSSDSWREKMAEVKVLSQKGGSMKKIMVITALDTEAADFVALLKSKTTVNLGEIYATRGIFETEEGAPVDAYVCIGGVGNTQAALEASSAWRLIRPDLTLFIGIAGGRKEAEIGSVVIASRVYSYESGKERANGFSPRPRDITPSRKANSLTTGFLAALRSQPPAYSVYHKPIACGEKVLGSTRGASAKLVASIYGDALAVEMEGFGFMAAFEANSAPAVLVRGISDRLDKKEQNENHELAIRNATDIAARLIVFFMKAEDLVAGTAT